MDYKLEVIVVPVSDIDAAKEFYEKKMGFALDHDTTISETMRIVQLTPPGSGCSIVMGTGIPRMEPGSLRGVQLVVTDIEAARAELSGRGLDPGEVNQMGPEDMDGSKFLFFSDPDGNGWAIQEYKGSANGASD
jgi:catechol 2,3-dioxygenase-like lactoylglutathione lyase family enzyme